MPTNTEIYHQFLRTRRTVRRFKADPVPDETIAKILGTANYAPSAHNLRPWRFVVLKSINIRASLGKVLTDALKRDMVSAGASHSEIERRKTTTIHRLEEAPVVILLCRDSKAVREDNHEETVMSIQSVSNAGLTLLLAAHAEGLGGCWICWPLYAQVETRQVLNLPASWLPEAMFFIGHATSESPTGRESKDKTTLRR